MTERRSPTLTKVEYLMLYAFMVMLLASSTQQQAQAAPAAQAAPSAPTQVAPQETDDNNRQICRRERVVGSNRPQRICMTRREWNQQQDTSREMMDRARQGLGENLPRMGG